jgi:hypothetical protein
MGAEDNPNSRKVHMRIPAGLIAAVASIVLGSVSIATAEDRPAAAPMNMNDFNSVAAHHPAGEALERLFPQPAPELPENFQVTGLRKKDYLNLVASDVDFWKAHLSPEGAILDFYDADKKHPRGQEIQYSTPAFALAAAELVKEAGRDDLTEPAIRSFSFALTALQNHTTANGHADFYIPMLIHAHRILKERVSPEQEAKWAEQFKSLIPEKTYRDVGGGANWNIVNVSGEAMRRKDGLVATTQLAAQQKYLDRCLAHQQRNFTALGMYHDPTAPLANDAFPRLWLEDMIADGAYQGASRTRVQEFLTLGGFSTLLLMSPQGEWACGGRSAHHQWNEAENAVIAEINANKWQAAGRPDIAGAFKRVAHMGYKSMLRWRRPSGEMWIVKNFADPHQRFGFEGYSHNSQYNLLPMAMLCIAYERADDSISERPMPSEYGSYVFDARDPFTTVVAAAGGYFAEISTDADPHYNGTGLQRVHRAGIELSPLTDSSAPQRVFGAAKDDVKKGLTPEIQWKDSSDGQWIGLADFHRFEAPPRPRPGASQPTTAPAPQRIVKQTELAIDDSIPARQVIFTLTYHLDGPDARLVTERYMISAKGVQCRQEVSADGPAQMRFAFPSLVNDGARDTQISSAPGKFTITRSGGILNLSILQPPAMSLALDGPKLATHNGYVRAAITALSGSTRAVSYRIELSPAPLDKP